MANSFGLEATIASYQTIYDEVDYSGDEDDILKHILANNVVEDAPPFPPPKVPSTPDPENNLEPKSSKAGAPALEVGSDIAVAEKSDFLNADKRPFASNGRLAGHDEDDSTFSRLENCSVIPSEGARHDPVLGTRVEPQPCMGSGRSSRVPSGLSLTSESNREHPAFAALFAAVELESSTNASCSRGANTEKSPMRASVSRDSRQPGQSRMRRSTRSSPLGSAVDIMYSRRHQESRARQRYVYDGPPFRSGAIANGVHSERVNAPPVPWDVRPRHSVRNTARQETSVGQRRHSRETHRSSATLVGTKIGQNPSGLEPRSRPDVFPNVALGVDPDNLASENRERSPTPRRQENSGSQRGGSPHGFDGSSVIGESWEFRAFNYSRGFVPDLQMSSVTDRYYDTPSSVRDSRRRGQESSSRSPERSMSASRDHWRHIDRHPDFLEGNRWENRRGSATEVEKTDSRAIHRHSTSHGDKFRDPIPMDMEKDSSLSIKDNCPPNRKRPLVDEVYGVSQKIEPFVRGDEGKDRRNRTPPQCTEHLEEKRPQSAKRPTRRERDHWMPMSSILFVDEDRPVKKPRVVDAHVLKERTSSRGTHPREHWRNACKMTYVAKAAVNGDAESIETENVPRGTNPKVDPAPLAPLTKETPDADVDCAEGQKISEAGKPHDRPSGSAGGPPSSNPLFGSSGDSVRQFPSGAPPPRTGNRLLPASGFAPPVVDIKSRLGSRLPRERLPPAFGTSVNAGGVSAVSTNAEFRREIRICGMASAASAPSDSPPDPGPPCRLPSPSEPNISGTFFGGDRQSPVPRQAPPSGPACVTAHPQLHNPPGILAPGAAPAATPPQSFDDSSSAERRIPPGVDLRTLVTASRAARESRQPDGPQEPPQEQLILRPTSSSSPWSAPHAPPATGASGIGAATLLRHAAAASQPDADGLTQTPASGSSRGLSFKGAAARQREKSRMIIRQ